MGPPYHPCIIPGPHHPWALCTRARYGSPVTSKWTMRHGLPLPLSVLSPRHHPIISACRQRGLTNPSPYAIVGPESATSGAHCPVPTRRVSPACEPRYVARWRRYRLPSDCAPYEPRRPRSCGHCVLRVCQKRRKKSSRPVWPMPEVAMAGPNRFDRPSLRLLPPRRVPLLRGPAAFYRPCRHSCRAEQAACWR